jgi:hypothetical protein
VILGVLFAAAVLLLLLVTTGWVFVFTLAAAAVIAVVGALHYLVWGRQAALAPKKDLPRNVDRRR